MLDKEKINEIAGDMQYSCTKHDLWPSDAKEIAKALTILGYQKVREDEVVISKNEYENLKNNQMPMHPIVLNAKQYSDLKLEAVYAGIESAKKFYDKFNENICYFKLENKSEDYKDGYIQAIADICGRLDQTAIELGVNIKE